MEQNCCCERKKERSEEERKRLNNRLSRIEGQVRGLKRMIDQSAYCTDIVLQISAITAALNAVSQEVLLHHVETCLVNDIRSGKEGTVEDFIKTIKCILK